MDHVDVLLLGVILRHALALVPGVPLGRGDKVGKAGLGLIVVAMRALLVQAIELGVRVEDGRATDSGRVWVRLLSPPDNRHRRLARKLIELGFEYSPGKGYWR